MTMTSQQLCHHLGISYRQLDYACRLGLIPDDANGSGTRRRFHPDTIARLSVAAQVMAATAAMFTDGIHWPEACASVMRADQPPAAGYALVGTDGAPIVYTDDDGLAQVLVDYSDAVLVVPYDTAAQFAAAA